MTLLAPESRGWTAMHMLGMGYVETLRTRLIGEYQVALRPMTFGRQVVDVVAAQGAVRRASKSSGRVRA